MKLLAKFELERFTTVEFLRFGLDWTHIAEIRFSENKDLPDNNDPPRRQKARNSTVEVSSQAGSALAAVVPRHGGGHPVRYGEVEQRRILAEVARPPDRARDGAASWSLTTLRAALRRAEDGLPGVSTYTIGRILHAAGFGWQKSRTWCETGVVVRKRKQDGLVSVTDPDAAAKRG
jgi:hypothetical protein